MLPDQIKISLFHTKQNLPTKFQKITETKFSHEISKNHNLKEKLLEKKGG